MFDTISFYLISQNAQQTLTPVEYWGNYHNRRIEIQISTGNPRILPRTIRTGVLWDTRYLAGVRFLNIICH